LGENIAQGYFPPLGRATAPKIPTAQMDVFFHDCTLPVIGALISVHGSDLENAGKP
jgi:hypothetical protein